MPVPTCSADCSTQLGAVKFSECAPEINLSEIRRVFIAVGIAAAFADFGEAAEWVERISAAGTDPDAIRSLTVIGDKPAATPVTRDISGGRQYAVGKDHTLNVSIDDTSDENYEFMRNLECGGQFRVWFETNGGKLYGGNEGILTRSVIFNDVLNRGVDEIETIEGTISWRAKFHPDRTESPIFNQVFNGTITPTP